MGFDRTRLPDAADYFASEGLVLKGPSSATWKSTKCDFHGGSDSMRINVKNGAFKCMNCQEGGGDVLAYAMKKHMLDFVEAAKSLGAWADDGKPRPQLKPTTLPPRLAIQVLTFEANLSAIAAGNIANGITLSDVDRARLLISANRISRIAAEYAA